jgi:hypothetical protein
VGPGPREIRRSASADASHGITARGCGPVAAKQVRCASQGLPTLNVGLRTCRFAQPAARTHHQRQSSSGGSGARSGTGTATMSSCKSGRRSSCRPAPGRNPRCCAAHALAHWSWALARLLASATTPATRPPQGLAWRQQQQRRRRRQPPPRYRCRVAGVANMRGKAQLGPRQQARPLPPLRACRCLGAGGKRCSWLRAWQRCHRQTAACSRKTPGRTWQRTERGARSVSFLSLLWLHEQVSAAITHALPVGLLH